MLYFRKRILAFITTVTLLASTCSYAMAMPLDKAIKPNENIKNIIVLIADGTSVGDMTLTRWYNAYDNSTGKIDTSKRLALDEMASGLVRTYWQTDEIVGAITDSAPGGTALSTGHKTKDKYIAVSYDEKPMATILEASKTIGKSTGIVSMSQVMHATPADFSSHYPDRSKEEIIAEQQVYNNIDVVLGGGYGRLINRADKENLINVLKKNGYTYVTNKDELKKVNSKVWGMFAEAALAYDMDRETTKPSQPTLEEMTKSAIDILSKDEDGFFLMVEGSKVDWAAHANDPVGIVSEVAAYDKAVKVALDFAKKDQHTMVISVTDHGNGGLTIGSKEINGSYSKEGVEKFIAPLKKATLTGEGLESKLNADKTNIKDVMSKYYGIDDLTNEEELQIKNTKAGSLNSTVGSMISKRAYLGWTTTGHTGEDIVLYTYLPDDERITGTLENTDIPNICAGVWNINLDKITERLFVNANEAFNKKGAKITIDKADKENVKLVVTKGSQKIVIPENKNYVEINGVAKKIESVTVRIEDNFYTNKAVIDLVK